LFNLARDTLNTLEHLRRSKKLSEQGLVNGVTIALLALAEIGGVTEIAEHSTAATTRRKAVACPGAPLGDGRGSFRLWLSDTRLPVSGAPCAL
jgi:hypothetical protein